MSEDIVRADPRSRRLTVIAVAVAFLLCILAVTAFHHWLSASITNLAPAALVSRMRFLIGLALAGATVCLATLGWVAARSGTRAKHTEQWPLPAARVVRDTPMRRGAPAIRIGRLLQLVAIVLGLLAITAAFVSTRLLWL